MAGPRWPRESWPGPARKYMTRKLHGPAWPEMARKVSDSKFKKIRKLIKTQKTNKAALKRVFV